MSLFDHPRFYLLRHGQTAQNAAGLIAGATDAPLTPQGLAQARAAAQAWGGLTIGRLFASPLRRAWQTAMEIAATRPGLPITPAPLLAERHWGIWEGQPRAILDRQATPAGGESAALFHARILQGCAAIPVQDDSPLIVAHSGTVREIFAALDLPFLRPDNGALIAVYRDAQGQWRADPPRLTPLSQPT